MLTTALIFPIGRCLGPYHAGTSVRVHQVLRGAEVAELTDVEFAAWSLAHGFPDHADGPPWTSAAVISALNASPAVRDAAGVVGSLTDRGLLAHLVPGSDAATDFARGHRMLPLLLGLGASADEPDAWSAGFLGRPVVAMTRALYDVWVWAHLAEDLWAACEESALVVREAGGSGDPAGVLAEVLASLHVLLAPSAACLDVTA